MIFFISSLVTFILIIALHVFVLHLMIKRAIKSFVNPGLSLKGMEFVSYKWPGPFSRGDFKDGPIALDSMSNTGINVSTIYSYISYKDPKSELIKRITIKIHRLGNSVENVVYSSDIK